MNSYKPFKVVLWEVVSVSLPIIVSGLRSTTWSFFPSSLSASIRRIYSFGRFGRPAVMNINPWSWFVWSPGQGEINSYCVIGNLNSVHFPSSFSGVFKFVEVDETKTARSSRRSILDYLNLVEPTKPPELMLQVWLCGGVTETEYSNTSWGVGILTLSILQFQWFRSCHWRSIKMKCNFKTVFFINNDLFFYLDLVLDLETSPGAGEYLLKSLYE